MATTTPPRPSSHSHIRTIFLLTAILFVLAPTSTGYGPRTLLLNPKFNLTQPDPTRPDPDLTPTRHNLTRPDPIQFDLTVNDVDPEPTLDPQRLT